MQEVVQQLNNLNQELDKVYQVSENRKAERDQAMKQVPRLRHMKRPRPTLPGAFDIYIYMYLSFACSDGRLRPARNAGLLGRGFLSANQPSLMGVTGTGKGHIFSSRAKWSAYPFKKMINLTNNNGDCVHLTG